MKEYTLKELTRRADLRARRCDLLNEALGLVARGLPEDYKRIDELDAEIDAITTELEGVGMTDYYESWTENDLRNAIWQLANGVSIKGPYANAELLRAELRRRGLTDEGYHNT